MKKQENGFTLIELLIALVILCILIGVAVPSYKNYLMKGRRTDGTAAIQSIQMAQESYRANNSTYGTLATAWAGVNTSQNGYYTLAITNNSATGYTVTATAVGSQANDTEKGTACGTLTLTVASGTTTQAPSACWIN